MLAESLVELVAVANDSLFHRSVLQQELLGLIKFILLYVADVLDAHLLGDQDICVVTTDAHAAFQASCTSAHVDVALLLLERVDHLIDCFEACRLARISNVGFDGHFVAFYDSITCLVLLLLLLMKYWVEDGVYLVDSANILLSNYWYRITPRICSHEEGLVRNDANRLWLHMVACFRVHRRTILVELVAADFQKVPLLLSAFALWFLMRLRAQC